MATATKVDYKRELTGVYRAPTFPVFVYVPDLSFVMIDGRGEPEGSAAFSEAVEALYGVSYGSKFRMKRAGFDYAVMPLEGLWWTPKGDWDYRDRGWWRWTLMIMQPDRVGVDVVADTVATMRADNRCRSALAKLRFERWHEGPSAQVLHIGPYATEPETIERLHAFIDTEGYEPVGKHHEIYLGDPRRTAPQRLRTILRQPVAPKR